MTGELAPARHVLSAATRCWEPRSDRPRGAAPVAHRNPDRPGPGDPRIRRTEHERSVVRITHTRLETTEIAQFTGPVDKTGEDTQEEIVKQTYSGGCQWVRYAAAF